MRVNVRDRFAENEFAKGGRHISDKREGKYVVEYEIAVMEGRGLEGKIQRSEVPTLIIEGGGEVTFGGWPRKERGGIIHFKPVSEERRTAASSAVKRKGALQAKA